MTSNAQLKNASGIINAIAAAMGNSEEDDDSPFEKK